MIGEHDEIDIGELDWPDEFFATVTIDMDHISDIEGFGKLSNKDVQTAFKRGLKRSADGVRDVLEDEMDKYEVGKLKESLVVGVYSDEYEVRVDDDQAMFVEFGTGITGKGGNPRFPATKHPEAAKFNWVYDHKGHGLRGWIAPLDKFDPIKYKYKIPNKNFGWTQGLPSRPFFHSSVNRIQRTGLITRRIRKELRKFL